MTQTATTREPAADFYRGGATVLDADAARKARREAFARALSQARLSRGLTQPELAALVGITQSAVSFWESGENAPRNPDDVFAIEDALKVDPGYLSQHLGFVPTKKNPPADVETAINESPMLTKVQKSMLVGAYRDFVTGKSGPRRA